MKKIKFRGKTLNGGHYVYGAFYLCPHTQDTPNDKGDALDYYDVPYIVDEEENYIWVYPDSVAQFVGYDKNGNEIYEGDKFNDKYGHTLTAHLKPQAVSNNGHIRFDWLPDNCEFHIMPDDFEVEEDYINEKN